MAYPTGFGMVGSQPKTGWGGSQPPGSSFGADGVSPNYLPGPNGQRPAPRPPGSSFGADGISPNYLPGPNGERPPGFGMVGSQSGGYGGVSDLGGGYTGAQTGGGFGSFPMSSGGQPMSQSVGGFGMVGSQGGGYGGVTDLGGSYTGAQSGAGTGSAAMGLGGQPVGGGWGMVGSQAGGTPDYAANYAAADAMRAATPANLLPAGFGGPRAGAERMAQGIQDATQAKWGRANALRSTIPQMSEADYSAAINAGNDAFNASGGGFGGVQGAGQNNYSYDSSNPFGAPAANQTMVGNGGGFGMVGSQGGGTLGGPGDVGSKATDAFNQYRAIQAGQPLPDTGGAWTQAGSSGSGSNPLNPGGQAMSSYGYSGAPQLGTGPAGTGYGLTDLGAQAGQAAGAMQGFQSGQSGQGSFSGSSPNGYLGAMADEIQRRSSQELGRAQQANRSHSIGGGGFGGGRQGVAEALSTGLAQDSLQGNLAGLFGGQYNQDANRGLQRYGMDQNFGLGLGGLNNQRYGMDQNFQLGQEGQRNNFYTQNRQLDQSGAQLGANLFSQGAKGEWDPISQAGRTYQGFTDFGSQTNGGSGGSDWEKILGGLMAGGSFGQSMGWWGK